MIVVDQVPTPQLCQIVYNLVKSYLQLFNVPTGELSSSPSRKNG